MFSGSSWKRSLNFIDQVVEEDHNNMLAEFEEFVEFMDILDGQEYSCCDVGEKCTICAEISEFLSKENMESKEDSEFAKNGDFGEIYLDEEASKHIAKEEENLSPNQEDTSWHILRDYKQAIGWTLEDIYDPFDPFKHATSHLHNFGFAVSIFANSDSAFAVSAVSAFCNSVFFDFTENFENFEIKQHVLDNNLVHSSILVEFVMQDDDYKLSRSKSDLRIAIGAILMDEEHYHETTLHDHEDHKPFKAKDAKIFHVDPG